MNPLYEGAIIGALTGITLLGTAACWYGLMVAFIVSIAQFSGTGFLKIAGLIAVTGVFGGAVIGGSIGLLSRYIFTSIEGIYIGVFAGAITLCFGGFVANFATDTHKGKYKRALASGRLGLVTGGLLGGFLGLVITLTMKAIM